MPQSKPFRQLAEGAFELRVKDKGGVYGVFYVLVDRGRIFVPHAFSKKSQKTPLKEVETGKKRLRRLVYENQ